MVTRRIGSLAMVLIAASAFSQEQFGSVKDAIAALADGPSSTKWSAVQYLANHPDESIPQLFWIVENQKPGWENASSAIVRSKDARALPFFTRLLADNFFLKEADGSRKKFGFGSKNGCLVMSNLFGSVLAMHLGELGDPAAIPTLRDATSQGDAAVEASAYDALYRLGAVTLDELFSLASVAKPNLRQVVEEIGWRSLYSDPKFAIALFDRTVKDFADDPRRVAGAHFWKIQAFENDKDYGAALREVDELMKFENYENLVSQARARILAARARP
jgi:HEAT repeat protein